MSLDEAEDPLLHRFGPALQQSRARGGRVASYRKRLSEPGGSESVTGGIGGRDFYAMNRGRPRGNRRGFGLWYGRRGGGRVSRGARNDDDRGTYEGELVWEGGRSDAATNGAERRAKASAFAVLERFRGRGGIGFPRRGRGGDSFRPSFRHGGRRVYERKQVRERDWHEDMRGRLSPFGKGVAERQPYRFGYTMNKATVVAPITLDGLCTLEPETLVKRVDCQLKEFQKVLGSAGIVKPDSLDAVVIILSKLVKLASGPEGLEQSMASKIVAEILSAERCEQFHFYLNQAVKTGATVEQAENLCNLFSSMLNRFESLAWDRLPVDELYERVKRFVKDSSTHSVLMKKIEELCKTRDQIRILHSQKQSKSIENYERDDSEFKLIPILPEWKEIQEDSGTPPEVRPNKVDAPYKDWMEYYDVQFRLIREDFIAPLRRGVAAFLQGDKGKKNRDVKIYSGAMIVSQVTTKEKGICFTIQFDVSGFRRVNYNWDQSKRLIFGSLLCFIPMGNVAEDPIIFATVADRDIAMLQEGKIVVQFEGTILEAVAHHQKNTEFEVVESNSYFGAVSPILQSLQNAEVQTMPFTRQLIEAKYDTIPLPVYLSANNDGPPISYNLSCLHGSKRMLKPSLQIEVLNRESWEAARDSELDSSQLNAIQTALTQEIAVIQGPPGTGKTYIGLKIVEALLDNREVWDPHKSSPILVMCYTNHALDQFLEGIIDTEWRNRNPKVIRVGGRCKNEKVDKYNLSKSRKGCYNFKASFQFERLSEEMEECDPSMVWQSLSRHFNKRRGLLPLVFLQHIAHPYHYYQLTQMAECAEQIGREVEVWLDLWEQTLHEVKMEGHKTVNKDYVPPEDSSPLSLPNEEPKEQPQQHNIADRLNTEQSQEESEEFLEIKGEATLAQDDRMDEDDVVGFQRVEVPDYPPEVADISRQTYGDKLKSQGMGEEEHEINYDFEPRQTQKLIWVRKKDAENTIRKYLFKRDRMDNEEVEEISLTSIMSLSIRDRWRLYNYWEEQRYIYLQEENRMRVEKYSEKCRDVAELRQREDRYILESADVVGMTTTGAAKYQHILHHIKPKIVIVEEAAEVLEAHIVSALSAGTQHLILIGDHKQLRPKPNEHVLATKYNLSISLFERLVMKQMSQATLEIQHRMRPGIARLVCPHVYEKLLNHESVEKYPDIRGISKNLFFIRHTEPESEHPNLLSYQNEFEAKYIAGLCAHLLRLGYSPSQITILTPYVGQLLMLRNKMPKSKFEGVRVTAIDNFQGEENDIILFSMVRSTIPNSSRTTIGFMKEDNRVCVSLSRAKHGFYAIGNFELIRHQSRLWESIISDVESRGCYGDALPLYCCNHPETKYSAVKDSDFKTNAPNGGCREMCNIRLPCGHACTQICHVVDTEHCNTRCEKTCEITLDCGHSHSIPCYRVKYFECPTLCLKVTCEKEHQCKRMCHYPQPCGSCTQLVTIQLPECLHEQNLACYVSENPQKYSYICDRPCEKMLDCGHACPKKCGKRCEDCREQITITLPCNHLASIQCFEKKLKLEIWQRCKEKCTKTLACGHLCSKLCSTACTTMCLKQVTKELSCGHKVKGKCYNMQRMEQHDFTCKESSVRRYPCGHVCKIPCSSTIEAHPCRNKCPAVLSCGHNCSGKCGDCYSTRMHAVCNFEITLSHYSGNSVTLPCAGLSDSCDHNTHQVPCAHKEDYRNCQNQCIWNCKHLRCGKQCREECDRPPCNEPCDKELHCGHRCPGLCGERCMSVCPQCEPVKFVKRFYPKPKKGHIPKKQCFFELRCGHIITVRNLDQYMKSQEKSIRPKQCPKCHYSINVESRYGNIVKKALGDLECVKDQMRRSSFTPDSEISKAHYAEFWRSNSVCALLNSRGFIAVKKKLDDHFLVTNEEVCLVQCVDSVITIHIGLHSHDKVLDIKRSLIKVTKTLVTSSEKCLQPEKEFNQFPPEYTRFQVHLSWQLLKDFMSELYRLALSAQCAIARNQLPSASEMEGVAGPNGPEQAIASVEQFVLSLNPLKDRISEAQYEENYSRLSSAVLDIAHIHVRTPHMPTVIKGTWMKCSAGHYYCVPPVCGARAKTTDSCPHCHT